MNLRKYKSEFFGAIYGGEYGDKDVQKFNIICDEFGDYADWCKSIKYYPGFIDVLYHLLYLAHCYIGRINPDDYKTLRRAFIDCGWHVHEDLINYISTAQ